MATFPNSIVTKGWNAYYFQEGSNHLRQSSFGNSAFGLTATRNGYESIFGSPPGFSSKSTSQFSGSVFIDEEKWNFDSKRSIFADSLTFDEPVCMIRLNPTMESSHVVKCLFCSLQKFFNDNLMKLKGFGLVCDWNIFKKGVMVRYYDIRSARLMKSQLNELIWEVRTVIGNMTLIFVYRIMKFK